MAVTRRALLGLLSGSTFFLSAGHLYGKAGSVPEGSPALAFAQGVASGDPQPDAVMLWTRAVPSSPHPGDNEIPLLLQVSRQEDFAELVLQEKLHTSAASDYTVRVYLDHLLADTVYFYRFVGGENCYSRTGRTRTAPRPDQQRPVKLAFASCQSYEDAYYGSWARMIADDKAAAEGDGIDFVLHLGDFIYERSWNARSNGLPHSRKVPPFPDGVDGPEARYAVSLADYRHLYRTYLEDPHLQEARARWPFVCTWDDHEFSNDNFQSFSTYGKGSRLEPQRRLDANQAWFEYIPCVLSELENQPAHDFRTRKLTGDDGEQNLAAAGSLLIYRQLRWGRDLDLLITDSRSYRSPPCLPAGFAESMGLPMNTVRLVEIADAGREYNGGNPPDLLPYGDGQVPNPARDRPPGSLLGTEQRDWFLEALEASTARWKLWGNALPLMPMRLDLSALPFTGYQDSIFSIDAWAGFPHETSLLMRHLQERGISGVVSLSGDHHMHGAGAIRHSTTDLEARPVSVDFTVAGISSTPLFEDLYVVASEDHPAFQPIVYREENGGLTPVWNLSMLQGVFAAFTYSKTGLQTLANWLGPNYANPGLKYVDTTANGYGLAQFEEDTLTVQLVTVAESREPFETTPEVRYRAHFTLPWWQNGELPELQGPEFDGGAPFPFEPPPV
jgi:alkaline phosphatase D